MPRTFVYSKRIEMILTRNLIGILVILTTVWACGRNSGNSTGLSGAIKIDGSSTVYPITEAMAEEYRLDERGVRVTVGVSGTGGGFNKFSRGEIDINNASRLIKESEAAACSENNIAFEGFTIAYDGLVVVVNKDNHWVDHLTVEELKKIWEPAAQGTVTRWSEIREGWPDETFNLYGPGIASGTYDYFTEAVVGESGASRGDYTASEDDNVLVQGLSGDKNGLAFFGLAYYEENKALLKLVPVDNGNGPVLPSMETVKNGTYEPLARPVFLYVTDVAAKRPEVRSFVEFYLKNADVIIPDVGYIPLTEDEYQVELAKLQQLAEGAEPSVE